jgi:hypothetical protein
VEPPPSGRDLEIGLVTGAVLGLLGPCLAGADNLNLLHALVAAAGIETPYFDWLPLLLVVGAVFVVLRNTRRFGVGLLIGGAGVGTAVAGLCTAL